MRGPRHEYDDWAEDPGPIPDDTDDDGPDPDEIEEWCRLCGGQPCTCDEDPDLDFGGDDE